MTMQRYSSSAILATGMVFLIFLLMQGLVRNDFEMPDPRIVWKPPFDRTIPPDDPITPIDKPEPLDEVTPPPSGPSFRDRENDPRPKPWLYNPNADPGFVGPVGPEINPEIIPADTAMTSIVKIAPVYPPDAIARGIEGDVLVEFTVTDKGLIVDCKVMEDASGGTLGRAACKAARRFKFNPQMIDGQAVTVAGVRHMFTFELGDAR